MAAQRDFPVPVDQVRSFGTQFDGAKFTIETGEHKRVRGRHVWVDQDVDGSWIVMADAVGPGDHDDRPPEGCITVYDPVVAAFLERFHQMMSDPVGFGHQTIGQKPDTEDAA